MQSANAPVNGAMPVSVVRHGSRASGLVVACALLFAAPLARAQERSISGRITYYTTASPVPGVTVCATNRITSQSLCASTASNGQYHLSGLSAGPITLHAVRLGGVGFAISSLDAARVLQYEAGQFVFTPLQALACDVTADGRLSTTDAIAILQNSAQGLPFAAALACGSDWVFVAQAPVADGVHIPPIIATKGRGICGAIEYDTISGPLDSQDFLAALFGDCTGNGPGPQGAISEDQ